MTMRASCDETPTVVTSVRLRAGFVPAVRAAAASNDPEYARRIDDACEALTWRYDATDWLTTTTQTSRGWVSSCVLSRFELGEQIIVAVVASEPRETREQAEGYVLGQLMIVGESV